MKKFFILFLFSLPIVVSTANAQFKKAFLNAGGAIVDSVKAKSFIMYNKISDSVWVVKQYTINNTLLVIGTYKDSNFSVPNGRFFYYEKPEKPKIQGFIMSRTKFDTTNYLKLIGQYSNGDKTGNWTEYSQDGSKLYLNTYKNDKLDGLYEKYFNDTTASIRGNYVNDQKQGEWHVYSIQGTVMRTEFYEDNKIINTIITPPSITSAIVPEKMDDYLTKGLSKVIGYGTNGVIFIECTITTSGKLVRPRLSDIKSNNELSDDIKNKLINTLSNCPLFWAPSVDNKSNQSIEDEINFEVIIKDGKAKLSYSRFGHSLYNQYIH